jgi:hypothetical protein
MAAALFSLLADLSLGAYFRQPQKYIPWGKIQYITGTCNAAAFESPRVVLPECDALFHGLLSR